MSPRLAVVAVLAAACGGGNQWSADNTWMSEDPKSSPSAKPEASGEPSATPDVSATPPSGGPKAPLGVRHDLTINPKAAKTARCSCLAVEVGATNEPRFAWETAVPPASTDALAIAISPRGVPCPGGDADENKRRASISAVDRNGGDVIVEVEELPEGRPLASGAIIPRPGAGGSVFVRGKNARLPYAREQGGRGCKVM